MVAGADEPTTKTMTNGKQQLEALLSNPRFNAGNPDTYRIRGAICDIEHAERRALELASELNPDDETEVFTDLRYD